MRADGNQQQADYLMKCGYWEYYYRLLMFNQFADKKNEANKPKDQ